jgi:SAM-dependent methyltransferase
MTPLRIAALAATTMALALAGANSWAQDAAGKEDPAYEPTLGQEGKDVVWVPTPQVLVDKMLDMAKATPADYVMDLGSGDGRTVITAAKRGIRALGVEYDPKMVALSKRNARKEGVASRATFVKQDLFKTDLSRATVITMFLMPAINLQLRPKILALKPGTRIVSNTFDMADWEADEKVTLDASTACEGYCTARLWIVPARVSGTHKTAQGELRLKQEFQKLTGTLRSDGKDVPVEGRIAGRDVVLNAQGRELRGKVHGRRLVLG